MKHSLVTQTYKVFNLFNIKQVPYVIITSSEFASIKDQEMRNEYLKPRMWHITSSTAHGSLTIEKLMEYVNGKT